jgi:hypothetical protein
MGTHQPVSIPTSFDGLQKDIGDEDFTWWAALLVKAAFAVAVAGLLATGVVWPTLSAELGVLFLSTVFAIVAGMFVVRQALLGECG